MSVDPDLNCFFRWFTLHSALDDLRRRKQGYLCLWARLRKATQRFVHDLLLCKGKLFDIYRRERNHAMALLTTNQSVMATCVFTIATVETCGQTKLNNGAIKR